MEAVYISTRASLNPALPSAVDAAASESFGRSLISLVRSMEKASGESRAEQVNEVSEILRHLIVIYSRRGFLQGNETKAQKLLETTSQSSAAGPRRGQNNKRSRGEDRRVHTETDPTGQSTGTEDEMLVFSALLRLLSGVQKTAVEDDLLCVVALVADVLRSITEHIKECGIRGTCAQAEQEMLLGSSRSLLAGLGATMKGLISRRRESGHDDTLVVETVAMISCLRATTSLISLFGTKIARSGTVIMTIRNVGWSVLIDGNTDVQRAAAMLLSTLPLIGGENKPPAEVWSSCVMDCVVALLSVLDAMAPLRKRTAGKNVSVAAISEDVNAIIARWMDHAREDTQNEGERIKAFQSYIQGLSTYFGALLGRETYDKGTGPVMITAKVPMENILEVADTMITFPSAAESLFFSTKKRLRSERIEDGLLSPASIALEMANLIKSLGHEILDSTISALGHSSLLPLNRSIMRISQASLLASSSSAIQRVVDPTSVMRFNEKRRKWLHTSVALRTKAIETYSIVRSWPWTRCARTVSLRYGRERWECSS